MSLFKTKDPSVRCGAIVDIGSGSIGIAIVVSNKHSGKLEVVWSHREFLLIKDYVESRELLKGIATSLMNAFLELGGNGVKALREYNSEFAIEYIQTAICAPWSYTVTKTIRYENDEEFIVTKEMVEQLIETARKQTLETLLDNKTIDEHGLRVIAHATVDIELNGYSIDKPLGAKCSSIALAHVYALAQEKILSTLEEAHSKILPKATLSEYSFMYLFYQVLKYLHPDTSEICLVDITYEATEIGIVRDNVLKHTTHVPIGMYTLARNIAHTCNIPKEEAYSLLKGGTQWLQSGYSEEKKQSISKIFSLYEEEVAKLFQNTGDSLSIPKTIFLHTSKNTEQFFCEALTNAANKATDNLHKVHLFTSELLGNKSMTDTALALSAHFFHTEDVYVKLDENHHT